MVSRSSVLLLGLLGCGVSDPSVIDEPRRACTDPLGCTTNSPVIKIYRTFDFNLDGVTNADGITFWGMSIGDEILKLNVSGSRMIGTDVDGKLFEGQALKDAKLWVQLPTGETASITITEVGQYPEAVWPHNLIETYVLKWADVLHHPPKGFLIPGGQFPEGHPVEGAQNYVCERVEGEDPEELGLRMFESTVFEGDIIDPDLKTIEPIADNRWFNIGCGKHLLAKLRLTRNTINTAKRWQQAQAAMKMFSADYCGTGHAYTVPGVKITYRDVVWVDDYSRPPTEIEARWSENGAICLQTPRLVDRSTVCPAPPPLVAPRPFKLDWWSPQPSIQPQPTSSIPYCADLDPWSWAFADELVTSAHY